MCCCMEVSTINLSFNGSLKNAAGPEDSVTFMYLKKADILSEEGVQSSDVSVKHDWRQTLK